MSLFSIASWLFFVAIMFSGKGIYFEVNKTYFFIRSEEVRNAS